MRVTRESLIRIAKENSQERAYNDASLVAVYLTGSLLSDDDPMLGGTTDIDLVFVHSTQPALSRQIVKLTPDFHLDIVHRNKADYQSPRELRSHPMLGWELYDPMLLYQREKFFEFIQAGLRAGDEFHSPALVLQRSRALHGRARQAWLRFSELGVENVGVDDILRFLAAIADASNSVAELSGGPLAERRFLRHFPARALAAERPDFTRSLFNLLGAPQVDAGVVQNWLDPWKTEFLAAAATGKADARIHASRLNYYEKGARALLQGETPLGGLWPLIHSWTRAAAALEEPARPGWGEACRQLGLWGASLEQRIADLDNFLDDIEVRLEEIAAAHGLEAPSSL